MMKPFTNVEPVDQLSSMGHGKYGGHPVPSIIRQPRIRYSTLRRAFNRDLTITTTEQSYINQQYLVSFEMLELPEYWVVGTGGCGGEYNSHNSCSGHPAQLLRLRSSIILDIYWDQLSIPPQQLSVSIISWRGQYTGRVKIDKIREFSIKSWGQDMVWPLLSSAVPL